MEQSLELIVAGAVEPEAGAHDVWYDANDVYGDQLDEWVPFVGLAPEDEDYEPGRARLAQEIIERAAEALARLRAPATKRDAAADGRAGSGGFAAAL